jgi:uncharacterized protein YkwD
VIHYFIPHHKNNFRALALRVPFLIFYPLFLSFLLIFISQFGTIRPGVLGIFSKINIQEVIEATNKVRTQNGEPTFKTNDALNAAANQKAQDMVKSGYWAHISPTGKTPWDFIKENGYFYSMAGENLARDFYDVSSMVSAWMASPNHRENILNKEFSEIGVGMAQGNVGGKETIFVVQMFATPTPGAQLAQTKPAETKPAPEVAALPKTISQKLELEGKETPQEKPPVQTQIQTKGVGEVIDVQELAAKSPLLDYFTVQKSLALAVITFLLILFFFDFAFAARLKLARPVGHPFAHFTFLLLALFFVWYTNSGLIL